VCIEWDGEPAIHSIVLVEPAIPGECRTAIEVIVQRRENEEVRFKRLTNTQRKIPLSQVEAENWLNSLQNAIPADVREELLRELCEE
jgi:hypothetical protein